MAVYNEYIGYRSNTVDAEKQLGKGMVSVYAERRNEDPSLGFYGGDAQPMIFEKDLGKGLRYGMMIVSDGLGNGAHVHESLERKLAELAFLDRDKIWGTVPKDKEDNRAMLSVFLRKIFGDEIFDDPKQQDVLDYALKSFSDVPCGGYFAAERSKWLTPGHQVERPFYKRDSQSLGSRILCVWLYQHLRNYIPEKGITAWDKQNAEELRVKVEKLLEVQIGDKEPGTRSLREAVLGENGVGGLFDNNEPDATKDKDLYFLCSTVVMYLYVYNPKTGKISAVCINSGDTRAYLIDKKDGVRQISCDDAFPNNDMSALVHFGRAPRTGPSPAFPDCNFSDGKFHARVVETSAPCALMVCSDGVYDTCPAMVKDGEKLSLPYGETKDANDFLFELNLLKSVLDCHSLHDFAREIVFNFYGGAIVNKQEWTVTESLADYELVKRDDSGTMAARFFGSKGDNVLEIVEELRAHYAETSIWKLYQFLLEKYKQGTKIPYYHPHVKSNETANEEKIQNFAQGDFKGLTLNVLKNIYPACYEEMAKDGGTTLWGIEGCVKKATSFMDFARLLNNVNLRTILNGIMADWEIFEETLKAPKEWKNYEHALANPELSLKLVENNFSEKMKELAVKTSNATAERELELSQWFEEYLFGGDTQEMQSKGTIGADEYLRGDLNDHLAALQTILDKYVVKPVVTPASETAATVATKQESADEVDSRQEEKASETSEKSENEKSAEEPAPSDSEPKQDEATDSETTSETEPTGDDSETTTKSDDKKE